MSVLWKKVEFYKGIYNCVAIVMAVWGLEQSPGGLSGEVKPQNVWAF